MFYPCVVIKNNQLSCGQCNKLCCTNLRNIRRLHETPRLLCFAIYSSAYMNLDQWIKKNKTKRIDRQRSKVLSLLNTCNALLLDGRRPLLESLDNEYKILCRMIREKSYKGLDFDAGHGVSVMKIRKDLMLKTYNVSQEWSNTIESRWKALVTEKSSRRAEQFLRCIIACEKYYKK